MFPLEQNPLTLAPPRDTEAFCFAPPQSTASSIFRPLLGHSLSDLRDQLFDDDVPE